MAALTLSMCIHEATIPYEYRVIGHNIDLLSVSTHMRCMSNVCRSNNWDNNMELCKINKAAVIYTVDIIYDTELL